MRWRISAVLMTVSLSGCVSSMEYKRADMDGFFGDPGGYLDKEIAPGVYVIEVLEQGGYSITVNDLVPHWERRAAELCPGGYDGMAEIIYRPEAKIAEFGCSARFCQYWRLASGVARCRS